MRADAWSPRLAEFFAVILTRRTLYRPEPTFLMRCVPALTAAVISLPLR